jgi:hypothetical protein
MTDSDLEWAVDLLTCRREKLVPFAPVYWAPAPDAVDRHRVFLRGHLNGEIAGAIGIRTDHAVLFGLTRPDDSLVLDDVAVTNESYWDPDGRALILAAAGGSSKVRLVCPTPEYARRACGESLGLSAVEAWWHRELVPTGHSALGALEVPGAEVRLVDAPRIYAPGGPIAFVAGFDDEGSLEAAEAVGAAHGAVLSVVSQQAGAEQQERILSARQYVRHCEFLEGVPRS